MSPPPERAPAKVVPLIIPPSVATATAPLAPGAIPAVRVPQLQPQPTAPDLCAALVGRLNPGAELAQMRFGEWQGEFQDSLYQSLANDTGAEFFSCVLAALQSRGVDPRQAMAILAPLSQKVSADYFAAHPEQAPPPPPGQAPSAQPTVATPPAPDPGAPQLIPTTPLTRDPPASLVPAGPGGVILAASDDGISQKQWGMIAIAVLVVGGAAYYYARR